MNNKQRKIIFAIVGLVAITMLTMLNRTTVESQATEVNSYRMYIRGDEEDLAREYEDVKIEEQIQAEEDAAKYGMPADVADNGCLVYGNGAIVEVQKVKKEKKNTYSEEDLMLLAGIIENEANSDSCTDKHQRAVVSIVLNRVKSDYFPNTIEGVLFQTEPTIQYDIQPRFYNPTKRSIKNAKYVLENGSLYPSNCVFQSESLQGDGKYTEFKSNGSITYICYKN